MKYTTLKTDIIGILHSSDYNYTLKLYDEEGNTTLDSEETSWLYIEDKNIMIEMPTEESPAVCLWKDNEDVEKDIEKLIQRIRELSILNGVTVQIRTYDDLDRRKIYNIIKNSIKERKGTKMSESVESIVSKALYELSNKVRTTKRSSDNYVSESMVARNKKELMESIINLSSGIDSLNEKKIQSLLSSVMMESSFNRIKSLVESLDKDCLKVISENINSINNVVSFAKDRYLNNREVTKKPHTLLVTENVIVYPIKTKIDKENMVKAYNHLISVCEGAKTGTDILRMIKKHRICETYKVSKEGLMDMWLSKTVDTEIKPQTLIVFESVDGNTFTFNTEVKPSVKLLAEHFGKGGKADDSITQNIIDETIKLNSLTDLVENYSYNMGIKKYGSVLKQLYTECLKKLSSEDYKAIFESKENIFDYSKELSSIENKLGFKHPALKYIAIYESRINDTNNRTLTIERIKDERVLSEGLEMLLPSNKCKSIASSIIKTKLCSIKPLTETKEDKLSLVKSMYNNVYSTDETVKETLNECFFLMINNPSRYNKDRQKFVQTIKKYVM